MLFLKKPVKQVVLILVSLLSIIFTVVELKGLMSWAAEFPKKVSLCSDGKISILTIC